LREINVLVETGKNIMRNFKFLEDLARYKPHAKTLLHINIGEQKLYVIDVPSQKSEQEYTISTSENEPSYEEGSNGTPMGWFEISEKIGAEAPSGMVFKGRKATGKCFWEYPKEEQSSDFVTTRILRLNGLEAGVNDNTLSRYVYIHGTNHENDIGIPKSHGCIRMLNKDVIELFDFTPVKTMLYIER